MSQELFSDVDMNHPWVQQHRLPVIEFMNPIYGYLVSVVVPSEDQEKSKFYMLTSPTDKDAEVLGSFLEYTKERQQYRQGFLLGMEELPLDLDNTFNTISIMKRKDGTWAYKRSSWTQGPSPQVGWDKQCNSVIEILDYIENDCMTNQPNEKWTAWKRDHNLV